MAGAKEPSAQVAEAASRTSEAKALLEASGYVVLKQKSYLAAQERQRIVKVMQEMAEEDKRSQRAWMERDVFPWERHLVNRVTHLGNLATSLGATPEQMRGPVCGCGRPCCSDTWTSDENAPSASAPSTGYGQVGGGHGE